MLGYNGGVSLLCVLRESPTHTHTQAGRPGITRNAAETAAILGYAGYPG